VLTVADLRALRDFLLTSKRAFPVGQVTVIIPTARFEMAKTTKRHTIRRNPGTLSRVKKPGPKKKMKLVDDGALIRKELAPCYFCKREVDKNEYECSGCGQVVCDQCDELQPWGRHEPFEHTADGSED
jgi:hypothetical protein